MVYIGLTEVQKQSEILRYAKKFGVQNIIVFSDEHFFMELPRFKKIRQIGYKEVIMYRTFYPLLEEIDDRCLIVFNEMLRDMNRSCLTHNCLAKFSNQTSHRLVFQWLPIIETRRDLMILLDFDTSQRYKGQSLTDIDLQSQGISCVRREYRLQPIDVDIPADAMAAYAKKRDDLFDNLGSGDPNIIPRQLHIWTGRYKRPVILAHPKDQYVALNKRFRLDNVDTYSDAVSGIDYTLVDLPLARREFNDFLCRTQRTDFAYLSTGFPLDRTYIRFFENWKKELGFIYAQTGIYTETGDGGCE